jgi:hypothetical protein
MLLFNQKVLCKSVLITSCLLFFECTGGKDPLGTKVSGFIYLCSLYCFYPPRCYTFLYALISAKHNSVAAGFSEVRSSLSHNLRDINYAARLWQVFKAKPRCCLASLK